MHILSCLHTIKSKQSSLNKPISDRDMKRQLIKQVALRSLAELAVSCVLFGVTAAFVATPVGILTLAAGAATIFVINTVVRSALAKLTYDVYKLEQDQTKDTQDKAKDIKKVMKYLNYITPTNFALLSVGTSDTLIHEGGHALASKLLFRDSHPRVEINPFKGGVTYHSTAQLSKLGEFFGYSNSRLIVSGAGSALSVFGSCLNLIAAHKLRKKNPEISRYLTAMAVMNITQNCFYALSALWEANPSGGHDFVRLALGGVHPVAAVVSMVALPLLFKGSLIAYDLIKEKIESKRKCQYELI